MLNAAGPGVGPAPEQLAEGLHAFIGAAGSELQLNCPFPITAAGRVQLIDLRGAVLRTWPGNGTRDMRVPCGDLASGVYVVHVQESVPNTAIARVMVP